MEMSAEPAAGHEAKHPYHLVDPSPWPIVGAIAALLAFGGAVMALHDVPGGVVVMIVGDRKSVV
jgi:cytochrome c oxidase subunit 3